MTYGQTEIPLLLGRVIGDAPLKDFEEMKAHNVCLNMMKLEAAETFETFETFETSETSETPETLETTEKKAGARGWRISHSTTLRSK